MRLRAVVPVAILLVLTGCSSSTTAPQAETAKTPKTSQTPLTTSSPSPKPTPSPEVRTPLGAGQDVWAAFSRRGVAYDAWWAGLEPKLSTAARATFVYDDPRNLPAMRQTGRMRLAAKPPGDPHYTAEVIVPTDKGTFRLDLERHQLKSRWLLYAIQFPPSVQ